MIRHVIWDFNGTLLDDVHLCVDTLNTLLDERSMPRITRERYLAQFGFPVRDFYVGLGFDFAREDFERVSETYIERYLQRMGDAAAHQHAHRMLEQLHARGIGQSVLSAMEDRMLRELLVRFELASAFTHVRGLDDLGAASKVELGRALHRELALPCDALLLVGDTLHDHEVAQAIGCHCILVGHGHQNRERLESAGVPIVDDLGGVLRWIDRGAT